MLPKFAINNDYLYVRQKSLELPTLIAFSSVNTPKGKFKPFKIYDDVEANLILVNDDQNYWYQNGIPGVSDKTDLAACALVDLAKSIGSGRVSTFGTSMGAGGAVLHAALGGADACLAFGFETVLSQPNSRSLQHMPNDFVPHWPDMRHAISASNAVFYLYSSEQDEIDLAGALVLSNVANVVNISVVGVEHPGLQVFDLDNSIGKMLSDFALHGRPPTGFKRQGRLMARWGAVEALIEADRLKRSGEIHAALKLLEHADKLHPGEPTIVARMGNCYQALREGKKAETAWLKAVSLSLYQYEAHGKLANHYLKRCQLDLALHNAERAHQIYPRSSHINHNLGLVLLELNRKFDAIRYLKRSVEISPGNKIFNETLQKALQ